MELDGYTTVGVGVRITALHGGGGTPGLELGLRGDNLLDEGYQEVVGFPAPGRSLELTARLLLGGPR